MVTVQAPGEEVGGRVASLVIAVVSITRGMYLVGHGRVMARGLGRRLGFG